MPYNTTAIPPRKEPTGQTLLPLTRVKKIVAQDPDVSICSNNAAFVITLAAELFIQHLAQEAHGMTKTDRKPRRNIQYKDFANAVQHQENLEFLQDVVPRTHTLKDIREQAAATQARLRGEKPMAAGPSHSNGKRQKQLVVNGHRASLNGIGHQSVLSDDDPSTQLELEMREAGARNDHDQDVDMAGV